MPHLTDDAQISRCDHVGSCCRAAKSAKNATLEGVGTLDGTLELGP